MEACSCRIRHAAFSTTCTCWSMATSIFLTCRTMKMNAEYTFYYKNHFLVLPGGPGGRTLEIYRFLKQIPTGSRQYLRSISWFLSNVNHYYLSTDGITRQQWLSTVEFLAREIKLSEFNLTIDISRDLYILELNGIYQSRREPMEDAKKWNIGAFLAESLARCGPLKNLFFHVCWPRAPEGEG